MQPPIEPFFAARPGRMVPGMAKHSDMSMAAARIRSAQQERLRRLREAVEPVQADAARRAGVSVHTWSRMEIGRTTVDVVALARWCDAHGLPADYVVTGRLDGLPDGLKRALVLAEAEAAQQSAGPPGTSVPASPSPTRTRGRPRRNAGTAKVDPRR